MNWSILLADLAVAGSCGLFGGTIGSYFRSYWTEKGKHVASYQDIEFLLAEERGKAYEEEKGKRLATHEDVENVLNEVRAVTKETETIKAQIGSDLWLRQTVWNHKREAYTNLVKCSHRLRNAIIHLRSWQMVLDEAQKEKRPETQISQVRDHESAKANEYTAAQIQFFDALTEAEVFLGPDAINLFEEYRSSPLQDAGFTTEPHDTLKSQHARNFLAHWTNRLVMLAKRDLGIDVIP